MKGIIFNVLESFITDNYGEDTFEDIIANCTLETTEPIVGPGTYPDGDMVEIIVKSSEKLGLSTDEFFKKLGRYTFAKLAERHPNFVTHFKHPKDFLKTVDGVIHVEIRKLYQDSYLPSFKYFEPSEKELVITYYSKRKLYALMEGLIDGVAEYFSVPITQNHKIYEKDGLEFCDFSLIFAK